MSAEWSFKVLLVGDAGIGKTSFLKYNTENCSDLFNSIGIVFSNADVWIENNHYCKLHFWDIKGGDIYHSFYPNYYKTAIGCLLFFDTSNYNSFSNLPHWIKIIRKYAGEIPIVLIGTKADLNYDIYYLEVIELVKRYQLDGYYFTSIHLGFNKEIIFKHLAKIMINYSLASIKNLFINNLHQSLELSYQERKERFINNIADIRDSYKINSLSLQNLHSPSEYSSCSTNLNSLLVSTQPLSNQDIDQMITINPNIISLREKMLSEMERLFFIKNGMDIKDKEDYKKLSFKAKEIFYKFLDYFSTCPICRNDNEDKFLTRFYFDSDSDKKFLKERLLKLISKSKNKYYKKINLGIPCCNCFIKFFDDN